MLPLQKTYLFFMQLEQILDQYKIKPTAIRILVLREILTFKQAFSLLMLEDRLETVDKSTLFRTLTLFHEHHLVHTIDDGSGSVKYSTCGNHCCHEIEDLHPHFHCTRCNKTFCLNSSHIPKIELPEGHLLSSINFVIKGVCADCNRQSKVY